MTKTKIINIIRLVLGVIGVVIFMIPIVFSGIVNIGNIAGIMFFGVLLLWGIFGETLKERRKTRKSAKAIFCILVIGYTFFISLFAVESAFMLKASLDVPKEENTTLIVLGCKVNGKSPSQMLRLRIEAAYEYLSENESANAVLSGGQGPDEEISEAECMYNTLKNMGIDEKRLFIEDKSTSTRENIKFSEKIIKENALSENIAVVTNNFHLYRATLVAKDLGISAKCISAHTPHPLLPTYVMREYLGIFAESIV